MHLRVAEPFRLLVRRIGGKPRSKPRTALRRGRGRLRVLAEPRPCSRQAARLRKESPRREKHAVVASFGQGNAAGCSWFPPGPRLQAVRGARTNRRTPVQRIACRQSRPVLSLSCGSGREEVIRPAAKKVPRCLKGEVRLKQCFRTKVRRGPYNLGSPLFPCEVTWARSILRYDPPRVKRNLLEIFRCEPAGANLSREPLTVSRSAGPLLRASARFRSPSALEHSHQRRPRQPAAGDQ